MIRKHYVYVAAGLALCVSQGVAAAPQEADSAYRWGRWAVLSPAAGGAEPYVAANTPQSQFNQRPGDPFGGPLVEVPPTADDPRDRLPPLTDDPRDRLPPL